MPSIPGPFIARRAATSLAIGLAVSMLLAACGSTTAPSTVADPAAACAASEELTTSVDALDAVDLTTVGSDDLKPSIDAVSSAAAAVIEAAPADLDQAAEDMEGAVNVLEAAYEEASAGSIADSAAAIDAAILGVKTQAAAMELALKPSCP
jgi:hypothetical protein